MGLQVVVNMKKNKGFTILELIIVICIIGFLSAVVFGALNSVRRKSSETTIKSNLGFIRSRSFLYFNRANNFGTATVSAATTSAACSTANTIFATNSFVLVNNYIVEAENASDPSSNWVATCAVGKLSTDANATSWAVAVPLKTQNIVSSNSGTDYWCVDSSGNSQVYDSASSLGGGSSTVAKCAN